MSIGLSWGGNHILDQLQNHSKQLWWMPVVTLYSSLRYDIHIQHKKSRPHWRVTLSFHIITQKINTNIPPVAYFLAFACTHHGVWTWISNGNFAKRICMMHPNITPKLRDVIKHTFKFLYLFSVKMEVYLKSGFRFRKSRLCDIRTSFDITSMGITNIKLRIS